MRLLTRPTRTPSAPTTAPAPLVSFPAVVCAATTTAPTSLRSVTVLPSGLTFDGAYTCASVPMGLRIIVDAWPIAATALFFPVAGSPATRSSGVFNLTGSWASATQTWTLTPGAWIQRPSSTTSMIGFSGRVESNGPALLFSGAVAGASTCVFGVTQLATTAGRALP